MSDISNISDSDNLTLWSVLFCTILPHQWKCCTGILFWVVLDKYWYKGILGTLSLPGFLAHCSTTMIRSCFWYVLILLILLLWLSLFGFLQSLHLFNFKFWHFLIQYNFTNICVNIWMLCHYKSYGLKESIPKWKHCNLSESCSLWLHYYIKKSSIYLRVLILGMID